MSWTAPMTAIAGSVFTASQFNTFVRDNLLECPAAKATTPGSYFAVTDTHQLSERLGQSIAITSLSCQTTSTSYTDSIEVVAGGTSQGPALTLTTNKCALVFISASLQNNSVSSSRMAYEVSGASSLSPADNRGIGQFGVASVGGVYGNVIYHNNLTPGVNTFTCQYRVAGGTGTFDSRRLQVVPF